MALLDETTRTQIKQQLAELPNPITLHVFTQELECQFCRENRALTEELAETLPEQIHVEVHNFTLDKDAVAKYAIDKIPAIAVVGKEDYGVRFYGVPAGYEFTSFISAIRMVSSGQSGLSPASRDKLGALTKPLRLKVFVTLNCPYCPSAVHTAQQMAVANSWVTAEMIEAGEFPHLAIKEQVMGVPKTVVEGYGSFEGALPETQFVDRVVHMVAGGTD